MTEQAAAPTGEATTATPNGPWFASVQDTDLRGFAELKNFPNPEAVLKSYRDLERHIGVPADRLLKLPEKPDAPEWAGIRQKLGFAAPEKPEDYGFPDIPGAHPEYSKAAAQWAHEAGIPKDMALALAQKQSAWVQELEQAQTQALAASQAQELSQLKSEWGNRYAASEEIARRAVREIAPQVGLDEAAMSAVEQALGTAKFLKMWALVGSKNNAEDAALGTEGVKSGFGMSPEAAKAKIDMLKTDSEWFGRWSKGDARAVQEWATLNAIASGS